MVACPGRLQREGEVIHVVTDHLEDMSDLSAVSAGGIFKLNTAGAMGPHIQRGATHATVLQPGPGGRVVRDIYIPNLRLARASRFRRGISSKRQMRQTTNSAASAIAGIG
jgi:hypothetical protein